MNELWVQGYQTPLHERNQAQKCSRKFFFGKDVFVVVDSHRLLGFVKGPTEW